jgi:hypothetical protein
MHKQIEQHLEKSGIAWTHLRPTGFMQEYLREAPSIIRENALYLALGDVRLNPVDLLNAAIKACNVEIAAKKATVAAADVKKEEAALARLNAQKKRCDPKVAILCTEHQTLTKDKDALDAKKAVVRGKLEEHTKKVIRPYEARINELLDHFNAGFRIAETKPAYPGGVASSSYQIVINKTGIELGDAETPLDRPSFKNTLSAGDRSTLALAFFLAHLERDPDRATRIVVFDDPFTSQDSFRRRQTIYEIKKTGAACEQVVVTSHDAAFLRQLRDKCPAGESVSLQLADHRDLGIKITPCDLDEACRGRAASEMDDLQAYIMTGAGKDRDIIKKMRIVLETYCRSTYPGSFAARSPRRHGREDQDGRQRASRVGSDG